MPENMRFICLAVLCFAASTCPLSGEDNPYRGLPAIRIRNDEAAEKELPEVVDTGNNIIREKRLSAAPAADKSGKKKSSGELVKLKPPPESLAAKITDSEMKIHWQPKWRYSGTGGPWLPGASLSPDKSILAVAEVYGKESGPFGSRIVLINTYNWEIAGIIDLGNKKISKISFIPSSNMITCWSERQIELKQPCMLFTVGVLSGEIITSTNRIKENIGGIFPSNDGRRIFVTRPGKKEITIFDPGNLSLEPQVLKTGFEVRTLAVSPDNSIIAAAGNNIIRRFRMEDLKKDGDLELPAGFEPKSLLFAGNSDFPVVLSQEGCVLFFNCDVPKKISGDAALNIYFIKGPDYLVLELMIKNEFVFYSVPLLKEILTAKPVKLRPNTKAYVKFFAYLPFSKYFLALDEHGNIYVMSKTGRRWKKHLIIEPMR